MPRALIVSDVSLKMEWIESFPLEVSGGNISTSLLNIHIVNLRPRWDARKRPELRKFYLRREEKTGEVKSQIEGDFILAARKRHARERPKLRHVIFDFAYDPAPQIILHWKLPCDACEREFF